MDRDKAISVRVSAEEKARIEKQMRRENFDNICAYIRKVLLDRASQ